MPNATHCSSFYRVSSSRFILIMAWCGSLIVSRQLFNQGVIPPGILSWLVAALPMIVGVLLVRAFAQFMSTLDELWVKIYLRSLAFSFGVCVLALLCYPILEFANAPKLEPRYYGGFGILVFAGAAFFNARKFS